MSLGAKIKDVLTGSGSTETAPENRNVPGSFPADDVPRQGVAAYGGPDLTSSGSQRNKLHKANDPRGNSQEMGMPGGHAHTDSGVGLTEPDHAPQSLERKPVGGYMQDMPPAGASTGQHDSSRYGASFDDKLAPMGQTGAAGLSGHETTTRYQNQGAPLTQRSPAIHEQVGTGRKSTGMTGLKHRGTEAPALEKGRSDADRLEEPNVTRSGLAAKSSTAHKDPYWGDIAPSGGVYNTVTGHGSPEDANRHDASHSTETHAAAAAGSGATGDDDRHRAFPLDPSSGTTHHGGESRHGSTKPKQAAAGTAGIAGTALAARELDKKHDERAVRVAGEEDGRVGEVSQESKGHKESKIAGLFHRDHKEDKEHHHEHKREEKVDEPRHQQKEGGVMAFAHRDHKDDREAKHDSKKAENEAKHESKRAEREDKHYKKDEATAAAAAAYTAHAAAEDHDRKKAAEKKYDVEQPKEKKESKLHALFHRSHKDHHDEPTQEEKHGKEHGHKEHQAAVIAPAHETQARSIDQEQYPSQASQATNTGTTPWRDEIGTGDKHSNLGKGAAAAGVGGAAAYGASRLARKDDDASKTTEQGTRMPAATNQPTSQAQAYPAPGQYDATASSPPYTSQQGRMPAPHTHDAPPQALAAPPIKSAAVNLPTRHPERGQGDQYNVLPSGTASGVKVGNDTTNGRGTTTAPPASTETQYGSHHAAPIAAAAGAAGIGAAAYGSRRGDEPAKGRQQESRFIGQTEPTTKTQPKEYMDSKLPQVTAASGMPSGPMGSGQKVIHQCHKCGEANDISHYFSK